MEQAIALFQKAWGESNTYVALSNTLSTVLLIYGFYSQRGIQLGQELIDNGTLNTLDIKRSFLCNPNKPFATNQYNQQQQLLFKKYDDLVYRNIRLLKSNTQFSPLGDFYLAMCYFTGFAEDFIDYETCAQTAVNMLLQLCKLENKYAEKFMESLPTIS